MVDVTNSASSSRQTSFVIGATVLLLILCYLTNDLYLISTVSIVTVFIVQCYHSLYSVYSGYTEGNRVFVVLRNFRVKSRARSGFFFFF